MFNPMTAAREARERGAYVSFVSEHSKAGRPIKAGNEIHFADGAVANVFTEECFPPPTDLPYQIKDRIGYHEIGVRLVESAFRTFKGAIAGKRHPLPEWDESKFGPTPEYNPAKDDVPCGARFLLRLQALSRQHKRAIRKLEAELESLLSAQVDRKAVEQAQHWDHVSRVSQQREREVLESIRLED